MQTRLNSITPEYEYAGFWVRLAAYIIDCIIVSAGLLVVKLCFGIVSLISPEFSGTVFESAILFQYSLRDMILYLGKAAYFIMLTFHTGTTLGKRLLNLRVITIKKETTVQEIDHVSADIKDNHNAAPKTPDFMDVLYRETIGRFLSGILCIGYIIAGVDKEKRALHDILCDTRVIYAKKVKVYQTMIPVTIPTAPFNSGAPYNSDGPHCVSPDNGTACNNPDGIMIE